MGVPVMAPVGAIESQPGGQAGGRPGEAGPGLGVGGGAVSVVMALPAALDLLPGLATDTAPVIDQVKLAEPELPRLSVAVRVTLEVPEVVGVPVMAPVAPLSVSPVGRPVADQVRVAPVWVSVASKESVVIAVPLGELWAPGLVTATAPTTVQLKLAEPELPEPSVAVRVTL